MKRTNIDPNGVTIPGEYLALCPLDGRYFQIRDLLGPYISEYALQRERTFVEGKFLLYFMQNVRGIPDCIERPSAEEVEKFTKAFSTFSTESMQRIKSHEKIINHDVKAVELYVGDLLDQLGMGRLRSYVHIGCTSEDITSIAYGRNLDEAIHEVWLPAADELSGLLVERAKWYAKKSMLGHTHGQKATPLTMGQAMAVHWRRINKNIELIRESKQCGKLCGATGDYAAWLTSFPQNAWPELAQTFVEEMGLEFNPLVSQIEDHNRVCTVLDHMMRYNSNLRNFDRDMWLYISMEYFKQVVKKEEVGSSTMPNKVNPINFENSESCTGVANGLTRGIEDNLLESRQQRHLSDSATQRSLSEVIGYSLQAIQQTIKGVEKSDVNDAVLQRDLANYPAAVSEAIQCVFRKYGDPEAYDKLKSKTRGREVSAEDLTTLVRDSDLPDAEKKTLYRIIDNPGDYTGCSEKLAMAIMGC